MAVAATGGVAVAATGFVFGLGLGFCFGGGDGTGTGGAGDDSSAGGALSGGGVVATAAVVANHDDDVCEAVREEQITLKLSSPDVEPVLPLSFAKGQREENDFPSPRLDWPPGREAPSVPPEATELVILVMSFTDERAALYRADDDLWWDGVTPDNISGVPIGRVRWTLTGIKPTTTSLPRTTLSSPPAATMTEHFNSGTGTTLSGVDLSNKFIGADRSGETYLFTVFALCDPHAGDPEPDEYDPGWFRRHSIAIGWFFTKSAW